MYWMIVFYVNLMAHTRFIWEEESFVEKNPSMRLACRFVYRVFC